MLNLIYGPKGTGKTKQVIEGANAETASAKGDVVFIDKDNRKMYELNHKIRLVDATEYGIKGDAQLVSFIKGLLAGNQDIEAIYIDGISKITNLTPEESENLYKEISETGEKFEVKFVITVSTESLPEFLKKHTVKTKK